RFASLGGAQRRSESGRRPPGLAPDDAAEVTLVGKAELRGKPCDVALATGKALHGSTYAQAQPVAGNRRARCGAEDPAQIVRSESMSGEFDCALYELVRIIAATCCSEEQPLLEIDLG